MWNLLFGPSAAKKKDIPKKAILDVRQQLEMLQKKEKHLEQQIEEQDSIARKNVQSNKTGLAPTLPPTTPLSEWDLFSCPRVFEGCLYFISENLSIQNEGASRLIRTCSCGRGGWDVSRDLCIWG